MVMGLTEFKRLWDSVTQGQSCSIICLSCNSCFYHHPGCKFRGKENKKGNEKPLA